MNPSEKIIITGASDGIGKALAIEFSKRGHTVALMARRLEFLQKVKQECEAAGAPKVLVKVVDVAQEEAFEKALNELDSEIGGATVFIANAGVGGRSTLEADAWVQSKLTLTVNTLGAIHGLEVMKLKMHARGGGILCGVSSIAGSRGMPTSGAYSSSKAALTIHLETMRVDLNRYGIKVVTVAPGFIDTEMTRKNKGKMPFLGTTEKAAVAFANGILAGKRWVVYPRPFYFIYPLLQFLPRALFDVLVSKAYQSIRG